MWDRRDIVDRALDKDERARLKDRTGETYTFHSGGDVFVIIGPPVLDVFAFGRAYARHPVFYSNTEIREYYVTELLTNEESYRIPYKAWDAIYKRIG